MPPMRVITGSKSATCLWVVLGRKDGYWVKIAQRESEGPSPYLISGQTHVLRGVRLQYSMSSNDDVQRNVARDPSPTGCIAFVSRVYTRSSQQQRINEQCDAQSRPRRTIIDFIYRCFPSINHPSPHRHQHQPTTTTGF